MAGSRLASLLPLLPLLLSGVAAQASDEVKVQTSTFNSTVKLGSPLMLSAAGLNQTTSAALAIALDFERTNWAIDSVVAQSFYDAPGGSSKLSPGSLIKMEDYTSTDLYTLPPEVSLSRFLFQSQTLNGTSIPASAYVLWPYTARRFSGVDGVPVVAFAHGNNGWNSQCAPSHIRDLFYQYNAPFDLALSGYAVVAPDYAGLGVSKDENGNEILAEWFANPAGANDLMYAVQAARKGWPMLSEEFVVMGHSQGGGVAWGAAQRQADKPVDGYLGTIAASPVTSIAALADANPAAGTVVAPGLAHYMANIFPSFKKSDFLNKLGLNRLALHTSLSGCNSVSRQLFDTQVFVDGWDTATYYVRQFDKLTSNGGKRFRGPMLVLQGDADTTIPEPTTTAAVRKTCVAHPKHKLHYMRFEGVDHVPVLYASRNVWMDWIADRFKGEHMPDGCVNETVTPLREVGSYQKEIGFFLEYAEYSYELA